MGSRIVIAEFCIETYWNETTTWMKQYLELMQKVLEEGHSKPDRTGTGTLSLFGHQMRFDLSAGLPLLTTKRVHLRSILVELLWFLRGETNLSFLHQHNVSIWDEWADEQGELGPVYGVLLLVLELLYAWS